MEGSDLVLGKLDSLGMVQRSVTNRPHDLQDQSNLISTLAAC